MKFLALLAFTALIPMVPVFAGEAAEFTCSGIAREKSPYAIPAKEDQPVAAKLIGDSFDYCAKIIGGPEGRQMSLRELTLAALVHMVHHRGQSEVYLRAKGITPPTYTF
jgi:hypothetical protein